MTFIGGAVAAWSRPARAQQGYQRSIPFLIDLPGWTGTEPLGTDEQRKGGRVITAARSYLYGDARFYAAIFSGTAALAGANDSVHIAISGTHKSTSTIEGFQVVMELTRVFVSIAITLGPDAMFNLFFNNVSEDEAMAIARRFDWRGIHALVN